MMRYPSRRLLARPAWHARPSPKQPHARLSQLLVQHRTIHEGGRRSLLPSQDNRTRTELSKFQFNELNNLGEHGAESGGGSHKQKQREWYEAPGSETPRRAGLVSVLVVGFVLWDCFYKTSDVGHKTLWLRADGEPNLTNADSVLPDVGEYEGEKGIRVESPGVILSLEEACHKLREQAATFAFAGTDKDSQGRIDVIRLASNEPVEDEWYAGQGKGLGGMRSIYVGVFDGHAGWATSRVLKGALVPYVSTSLSQVDKEADESVVKNAIKEAFRSLDERILGTAQAAIASNGPGSPEALNAMLPAIAGSCALLAIYNPKDRTLRTAVTGDSRAVLGSWKEDSRAYVAQPLSKDQTGFCDQEVARLVEAHPGEQQDMLDPKSGRLFGMAITRAFGDHRWKYPLDVLEHMRDTFFDSGPRPKYKTPPYMTAEPEVDTRRVATKDFAILASDGLWDHMTNEDAVACVSGWLEARRTSSPKATSPLANDDGPVELDSDGSWVVKPESFVYEDLDSAAVCLVKNAFGGNRRDLFRAVMSQTGPRSRYVRDDITVQVVFFEDPYQNRENEVKAKV